MPKITWKDKHIEVRPPKNPKKITATRFATILGLNPWSTPFEAWCAITRTYEKPFEETIYTAAGKIIEPKQADYMRTAYGMDLTTPADTFGQNYFKDTRGDFFPNEKIFGGMWDYLEIDDETTVLEMKTTKRAEDWADDIPEYYALQAALYAYLLYAKDVIMVASFLDTADYEHPEDFIPSAKNTITRSFDLTERYPNFERLIEKAEAWWNHYVMTGISPDYDEKRDAEILKALRTKSLSPDTDIAALIEEGENLKADVDAVLESVKDKEKRLKQISEQIKEYAVSHFNENDDKAELTGGKYIWTVSKSCSIKVDIDKLMTDGLLDKYSKSSVSYRLTVK